MMAFDRVVTWDSAAKKFDPEIESEIDDKISAAGVGEDGPSGPPGLVWRGAWEALPSYAIDDAVFYSGRSWIAVQPSTGVTPPISSESSAYWSILADRAEDGGSNWGGEITPADRAFVAWAADPALLDVGARTTFYPGQMNGVLLSLPAALVSGLTLFVGVAGAGLSDCYVALIDAATGDRLAVSDDVSTTFQSGGMKRIPFTEPVTVDGGSVYAVVLIGAGTTMPEATKFPNPDTSLLNASGPTLPGSRIRVGQITAAGSLTSIPATNDMSGSGEQNTGFWVGVD